jgi:hypothetical protein
MPQISLPAELLARRGTLIRRLLQPVSAAQGGPASRSTSGPRTSRVWGAHDGGASGSEYRSWRFRTKFTNISGNYYEIWYPVDDTHGRFYLERAYLHFYLRDRLDERGEYLALHCDPEGEYDDEGIQTIYKKGPHFHVSSSEWPLPRAHIALTGGQLEATLTSVDSLMAAMARGIRLAEVEILSRRQRHLNR